jgi:hypothetical protein
MVLYSVSASIAISKKRILTICYQADLGTIAENSLPAKFSSDLF